MHLFLEFFRTPLASRIEAVDAFGQLWSSARRQSPRLVSSNGALGVRVREHVHMVRVREGRRAAVAVGMRGGAGVGVDIGVQV